MILLGISFSMGFQLSTQLRLRSFFNWTLCVFQTRHNLGLNVCLMPNVLSVSVREVLPCDLKKETLNTIPVQRKLNCLLCAEIYHK